MKEGLDITFVNKKIYQNAQEMHKDDTVDAPLSVDFERELKNVCNPEMVEFIKHDKFVRESLLMLFKHDPKTFEHSARVGNITTYIVEHLASKLSKEEALNLIYSALLHDYGKLAVAPQLLNKQQITKEDKDQLKKHVIYSFDAVRQYNEDAAKILVGHHEHQKDSYPRQSNNHLDYDERKIDLRTKRLSRTLSMIDTFEAMIANRPGNPSKNIKQISLEFKRQFSLPEDQEVYFLLEEYYLKHINPEAKIDELVN